jgi:hypothetical protein
MYHKIIFTYLTRNVKIWLWLWDFILINISGEGPPGVPLIFFSIFSPSLSCKKPARCYPAPDDRITPLLIIKLVDLMPSPG